jgi:tRNA(Ile)-lysidine synthase TilS/MesJ
MHTCMNSGGCDSVALLELVVQIRTRWSGNLNIHVVNFNHKLRPESDEECVYVEVGCCVTVSAT